MTSGAGTGSAVGTIGGTSAVAPLYAALVALINASLSTRVGYLNPTLYGLAGGAVFRDINDGISNAVQWNDSDGTLDGPSPGYTSGAGWDACTGLGGLDGNQLLNALATQMFATQKYYFQSNKKSFGLDEVKSNSPYKSIWLVLEGFTPSAAAALNPSVNVTVPGLTVTPGAAQFELPDLLDTPQRILYLCTVSFTDAAMNTISNNGIFPDPGNDPTEVPISSAVIIGGRILTAQMDLDLEAGADPYFSNFDPDGNNAFYLSEDLRVFALTPGINNGPIDGVVQLQPTDNTKFDTAAGYTYVQDLLTHLNAAYSDPTMTDPFSLFPDQSGALTGDSSVMPSTVNPSDPGGTPFSNYNFAVARVRLSGAANSTTPSNVRVFFRLFATETNDTDFQSTTYPSTTDTLGRPSAPLLGADNVTIPFFATGNYQANSDFALNTDYSANSVNNQPITLNSSGEAWAYYGCYLNIYPTKNTINGSSVLKMLPGTHCCVVAEIAYDNAPIPTGQGEIVGPENSDKLAQRNLQVTLSDNPGPAATHRVPQTFNVRPSAGPLSPIGSLLQRPDELMIEWGNTPIGSIASIYWPQVDASAVIALAAQFYSSHQLIVADPNTIQFKSTGGFTIVPIPTGAVANFAGLFTVDLPTGVTAGQVFTIVVRRLSTFQSQPPIEVTINVARERDSDEGGAVLWRYVVGTFAVRIPVTVASEMLPIEENTLAVMKWKLDQTAHGDRWYPVLQRYVGYIAGRVDGLGGNSGSIVASPLGAGSQSEQGKHTERFTGKVVGVNFDRFGDFEGFILRTETGREHVFESRESEIEGLIRFAWRDRVVISVLATLERPHILASITLVRMPSQRPDGWH